MPLRQRDRSNVYHTFESGRSLAWACIVWLLPLGTTLVESAQAADTDPQGATIVRVLTFNILQGGGDAANVGFPNSRFGGSRHDELAEVIRQSGADIVGVQEDDRSGQLLAELGDEWQRCGSIYAKVPLTPIQAQRWLTACRADLGNDRHLVVVNCHWSPAPYGPYQVQDFLKKHGPPPDLDTFESQIVRAAFKKDPERGYAATLSVVNALQQEGHAVVLTGDFNEPSHLDWTDRASQVPTNRWQADEPNHQLRLPIGWAGSEFLVQSGFQDAYREAKPDEVKFPGITWTPPYPPDTPGRRPYADQILDRIDMVYVSGDALKVINAEVLREVGQAGAPDDQPGPPWPSDHYAVLAVLKYAP